MTMTYLNPKNAVAFWNVFGDPTIKDRCISLLNSLLPLGEGCQIILPVETIMAATGLAQHDVERN